MITQQIQADILAARRNRESGKVNSLSFLLSEINKVGKAHQRETTDEEAIAVVKKTIACLQEICNHKLNSGSDCAAEKAEQGLYEAYLPQQLSETGLRHVIHGIIADGANNMGAVMKKLKETHGGQYDGRLAAEITKEMLQ